MQAVLSAIAVVMIVLLAFDLARWHRLSRAQQNLVIGLAMGLVIVGVLAG